MSHFTSPLTRIGLLVLGLALAPVLASCSLLPTVPAPSAASAGACPHLPAATISETLSSTVHFTSGTRSGPDSQGGYCVFTGGSPAAPFHITVSGISSSQEHGLTTDISLGYQSGTVLRNAGPSAVILPHPGGSAIEGCSAAHCLSIAASGITPSPAVLEAVLQKTLDVLDTAASPSASPAPSAAPLPSPCSLLDTYEVQQATGWYVTSTAAPLASECAYSNYDDTMSVILGVGSATPSAFTLEKAAAPSPFSLSVSPGVAYGYVTSTNGVTVSHAVISWKTIEVRIVITTTESEQYALKTLAEDVVSSLSAPASSPSPKP